MKETPFHVVPVRTINGTEIKLNNLMELCQGGPEVGTMSINGKTISGRDLFGGPILVYKNHVFAPVYIKSFFKTGFKISMIEINSGKRKNISTMYPLINLLEIKDGLVRFCTDLEQGLIEELQISLESLSQW